MSGTVTATIGRDLVREVAATLDALSAQVDWERAADVAARLDGARRVLLFGAGRSRGIALAVGQRLGHVGLDVALIGEAGNQRFDARDVLIVVSGSGRTPSSVLTAEQGKDPGEGTVVALTATPDSPIGRVADVVLEVPARFRAPEPTDLAPFTALFDVCTLVVGEALAKLVMVRRGMVDADIERHRPNVE